MKKINQNQKRKGLILLLVAGAFLIQRTSIWSKKEISTETRLVEACFGQSVCMDATVTKGVCKAYGFYGNKELRDGERCSILKHFAEELGILNGYSLRETAEHSAEGTRHVVTLTKKGELADTVLKLISFSNEMQGCENYLAVEISQKEEVQKKLFDYQKSLELLYEKYGMKADTNLYLCTRQRGRMTEEEMETFAKQFFDYMHADAVACESYGTVNLAFGYSDEIEDFVYQNGKAVNVNIVFSYDEAENVTYIHRAVPFVDHAF